MTDLMICPSASHFGCQQADCIHATPHKRSSNCAIQCLYTGSDICVTSTSTYPKLPEVRGMRAEHFQRLEKGFRGTLSRHGKTIIIVLEMPTEEVAENAENYICGEQ